MIVKLPIKCRICSHAWTAPVECAESPGGLLPPDDVECVNCGHRAGDATPNAENSGAAA